MTQTLYHPAFVDPENPDLLRSFAPGSPVVAGRHGGGGSGGSAWVTVPRGGRVREARERPTCRVTPVFPAVVVSLARGPVAHLADVRGGWRRVLLSPNPKKEPL